MFSLKRQAARAAVEKQEAETRRIGAELETRLRGIVASMRDCTGATILLTFKGDTSPVAYGGMDLDKAIYALQMLKKGGKTLKEHFAEKYAELTVPVVKPLLGYDWWKPVDRPEINDHPVKPVVSRHTSKFMGRLAKTTVARDNVVHPTWSDGSTRKILRGFPVDRPEFNGHPVKTGGIVDDYNVAGARFVIDDANQRWELLS